MVKHRLPCGCAGLKLRNVPRLPLPPRLPPPRPRAKTTRAAAKSAPAPAHHPAQHRNHGAHAGRPVDSAVLPGLRSSPRQSATRTWSSLNPASPFTCPMLPAHRHGFRFARPRSYPPNPAQRRNRNPRISPYRWLASDQASLSPAHRSGIASRAPAALARRSACNLRPRPRPQAVPSQPPAKPAPSQTRPSRSAASAVIRTSFVTVANAASSAFNT